MNEPIQFEQAVSWGLIGTAPILMVVGLILAVSITTNSQINIVPRIGAWIVAPIFGLWIGGMLTAVLLPGWGSMGVAWFFSLGWTATFTFAAVLGHDDTLHAMAKFWSNTVLPALKRFLRHRRRGLSSNDEAGQIDVRYTLFDDEEGQP